MTLEASGFAAWSNVVEVHSVVPVKVNATLGVASVTTQMQVSDDLVCPKKPKKLPVVLSR